MGVLRWTASLAVALGVAATALAVPPVVNFQGVLKSGGAPANGSASFKFAILDASGNTLWSNDGTSSGEPASAVTLPVNNGIFTAPLGDTSRGFAPLPSSTFGVDARLRVWTSAAGHGFEALSPDSVLTTVPYAAAADNSAAVGGLPAASVARGTFVHGFTSGLPPGTEMSVVFPAGSPMTGPSGRFIQFSATMVSAGSDQFVYGDATFRRPLSADHSWYTTAKEGRVLNGLNVQLFVQGTKAVQWFFDSFLISRYAIVLGDDGFPVEVITGKPQTFRRARFTDHRSGDEPGIGIPVGFSASTPPGVPLQVKIDGAVYSDCRPLSAAMKITGSGGSAGPPQAEPMMIRQNVTDDLTLAQWFLGAEKHDVSLIGGANPPVTVFPMLTGRITAYSLTLADDGLPVEEYGIQGSIR